MKILINKIGGQAGGINRRVYEISNYINSHSGNELVVLSMGVKKKLDVKINGNVKEYLLPNSKWENITPGKEKRGVPEQLRTIENFKKYVSDTTKQIENILVNETPDVCFVQGAFYFPWCLVIAAYSEKVPIVQLYCGSTQTEVFNPEFRHAYYRLEQYFAELANITIFNSKKGKSFIEKTFARDYSGAPIIYNGFPAEYAKLNSVIPSQVTIGWCGRNSTVKNMDYIFCLREYLSKDNYPMYLITSMAPDDPKLKKLAGHSIIMLNQFSPVQMIEFYKKVSCVLSTSHFEFFPNVIAEAIAAGRIPIVPKESGIAELLIENDLSELVYQLESTEQVAHLIMRSNDFQARVSELSRKMVANYSWEKVIERYLFEFKKLI